MSVKRYNITRVRTDDGLIGICVVDGVKEQFVHIDKGFVLAADYDSVAAERDQLKAELAELKESTSAQIWYYLQMENHTLKAELASARKDAARYNYLRTELSAVQSFPSEFEISFMLRRNDEFYFNAAGLDAYLDALIKHDAAIAGKMV